MIHAQIGWGEAHGQASCAAGEMEGAGLRGAPGAWLQQVGDICRGARRRDTGLLHGPGHGIRGVEVAQGHHFAHGVGRSEATRCKLEVVRLGPRREREKPQQEFVIAGFFALLQQWRGVIGVFDSCVPIVPSGMASKERIPLGETQAIWRGCERESLAGRVGRDGRTVGIDGNAELPGGSDRRHGGDSERRQRHRTHIRPLFVP